MFLDTVCKCDNQEMYVGHIQQRWTCVQVC